MQCNNDNINTIDAAGDADEEELYMFTHDETSEYFDTVIGHIEDIVMDDDFTVIQHDFMEKYYQHFEVDSDENKLIYTDIFKEYTNVLEKYIERCLCLRLPTFNMHQFVAELKERQNELDGEIFEILYSFTDFATFKEMFVDYKRNKLGQGHVDVSASLSVKSIHTTPPT